MKGERNREGFTLAEMLVTIAIIALLAAVIVPAVGGALFKGDIGRVQSDLTNIRVGIEQFYSDVRRYPGGADDLSSVILAAGTDLNTTATPVAYGASIVPRWKGPYINTVAGSTGAGGTIATNFLRVDCSTALATITTTPCLEIIVTGISVAKVTRIDAAMDDGVTTTGTVRFAAGTPGSTPDTLKYLAIPMQP
jgi:prepilin-type N-terminal cleavage/methylation domain-containing protein